MNDDILLQTSEGELLEIARRQGLGFLRRGLPRSTLLSVVAGYVNPDQTHYASSQETRRMLQGFITRHFTVLQSQLPGCDGKCTTFRCSEGRHAACFLPNEKSIREGDLR